MEPGPQSRVRSWRRPLTHVGAGLLLLVASLATHAHLAAAPRDDGPGAPQWVVARLTAGGHGIGLRWNAVAGAAAYELFRREGGGDFRLLATVRGLQHLDEAIQPGLSYAYRLRVLAEGVAGPFSEERSLAVPAVASPGEIFAPRWRRQRVEMTGRDGGSPAFRVKLGWRPVDGAVGYRLWRGAAGADGLEPVGTFTTLDVVDDRLEPGDYVYVLTAIDASLRESPRSLELPVRVGPETAADAPDEGGAAFPARLVWEVGNTLARDIPQPDRAPLTDPVGIAFDRARGRVYVTSAHHRHVVVIDAVGGRPSGIVGPRLGKHELSLPLGLCVDGAGNLVVVDQGQAALFVVAPDGKLARRILVKAAKGDRPPRLLDAAALRDGRILVTDAANARVLVYSADGRPLARWGRRGARPEEFGAIGAIEAAPDGTVAVADAAAGQLKVFSAAGKFLTALGAASPDDSGPAFLGGVAALRDGQFLAADLGQDAVKRLTARGADALSIGGAAGKLQLFGPVAIAGDGAGTFFVAEGIANRVVSFKLTPAGTRP